MGKQSAPAGGVPRPIRFGGCNPVEFIQSSTSAAVNSVEGNNVTHHVMAAWRADWVGGDQFRFVELGSNNKMTIKAAPLDSFLTGKQVVSMLTFEPEES